MKYIYRVSIGICYVEGEGGGLVGRVCVCGGGGGYSNSN